MYKRLIRPFFFLFQAETAHHLASFFLQFPFLFKDKSSNHKTFEVMGISFPSRLGMAAGFDKNATMFDALSKLGFGFVEVGTVTPRPQPGNDKPRLFRLKEDKALINRMGFNNDGIEAVAKRLKSKRKGLIIGGNIGKNKVTKNEDAINDYLICLRSLRGLVDYYVVNVSSPNTPGLRELQEKEPLKRILKSLQHENINSKAPRPILLKIAPDLTDAQLDDIISIVKSVGIQGVIATNTTIERSGLITDKEELNSIGNGGLSGIPVRKRSLEVVRYLREHGGAEMTIIGVGGIFSAADALQMIEAGADLVQVYTGFIYNGPSLIEDINRAIS